MLKKIYAASIPYYLHIWKLKVYKYFFFMMIEISELKLKKYRVITLAWYMCIHFEACSFQKTWCLHDKRNECSNETFYI